MCVSDRRFPFDNFSFHSRNMPDQTAKSPNFDVLGHHFFREGGECLIFFKKSGSLSNTAKFGDD